MKAPIEIRHASHAGLGYARHGHGPVPVLVLHDWLGDNANYEALQPWLDGQAFTHVFADLRGYGLSMALPGEFTVKEIAADGLALADRLGGDPFARGLLITSVQRGSYAARAGLRQGDLVREVNGRVVTSPQALARLGA